MLKKLPLIAFLFSLLPFFSSAQSFAAAIEKNATAVNDSVITWRRHLHQYPELSNREFKTAVFIASHLKAMGIDVKTNVGKTGVVGILKGGRPGPVVALRADMDALPVIERVNIPFASKEKGEYNGEVVGVMHACGHDSHVAILLGTASTLAKMKKDVPG